MRRAALIVSCLTLACAPAAQAGMSFNAGWQQEQERETALQARGYGLGVSFDLGQYVFFGVNYSSLRTESFEDAQDGTQGRLEYRSGGPQLGVTWPWTEQLGLTVAGGYAESSVRGLDGFGGDSITRADGATGSALLWYQPTPNVDFNVARGYSYLGAEPGWDNSAGVGFRVWQKLWLDGAYWRGEGVEGWTLGLRTALVTD